MATGPNTPPQRTPAPPRTVSTTASTSTGNLRVDIDAWGDDAIESLRRTHISPPSHSALGSTAVRTSTGCPLASAVQRPVRGTSIALDIPLDTEAPKRAEQRRSVATAEYPEGDRVDSVQQPGPQPSGYVRRRPSDRDSLRRREALLKGKEGSRRRQKWENDHFVGNPWVEPPAPSDWAPCPTHRVKPTVPYFLAPLWDERAMAKAAVKSAEKSKKQSRAQRERNARMGGHDKVPRELRQKMKRSKGAKGLLQDLEEQVREFVTAWEEKGQDLGKRRNRSGEFGSESGTKEESDKDSEDEEIVFVGRNGAMRDVPNSPTTPHMSEDEDDYGFEMLQRDKLVFDSLVDDHGASFGRWLVHTIAAYYNLQTYSITRGDPARREAYVSLPDRVIGIGCGDSSRLSLPQPLWGLV